MGRITRGFEDENRLLHSHNAALNSSMKNRCKQQCSSRYFMYANMIFLKLASFSFVHCHIHDTILTFCVANAEFWFTRINDIEIYISIFETYHKFLTNTHALFVEYAINLQWPLPALLLFCGYFFHSPSCLQSVCCTTEATNWIKMHFGLEHPINNKVFWLDAIVSRLSLCQLFLCALNVLFQTFMSFWRLCWLKFTFSLFVKTIHSTLGWWYIRSILFVGWFVVVRKVFIDFWKSQIEFLAD